jgi:hypothetical protein
MRDDLEAFMDLHRTCAPEIQMMGRTTHCNGLRLRKVWTRISRGNRAAHFTRLGGGVK